MTWVFSPPCQDERPTLVIWIVATHFVMIRGRHTTFDFLLLSAPTFISFLVENEMNTWNMKLWPPPGKPWCFFSMWQNYLNNKDSNVIYELFAFLCFYTALSFRFAFFLRSASRERRVFVAWQCKIVTGSIEIVVANNNNKNKTETTITKYFHKWNKWGKNSF